MRGSEVRRFSPAAAVLLLLSATFPAPCFAQYPERPIRILTPFPPGGAVDLVTRLVTDLMTSNIGRSFVIEAKAGAGGILATDAVAKSAPDGYTLLITTPNHTINAALQPKLPYDTEKDLTPIAIMAAVPEVLVSHPAAPFNDFADFVQYARANPGKLNYSSAGIGTLPHITMELLLKSLKISVAHVPYRGAAPAMTDLLSGVVQLKLDTYATSMQHVEAGKLRMLAYGGRARSPLLPTIPTIAEMGVPGYEGVLWIGLMAPAKTPAAIIDALSQSVAKAITANDLVERFKRDGIDAIGGTPEQFRAQIAREIPQWRDVIQSANIKPE
jgi:tripartite-type tricarboxylate transporter receptor subunit TctC